MSLRKAAKNIFFNGNSVPRYEYVCIPVNFSPAFTTRDGLAIQEINGVLKMFFGWDPNQWNPPNTNQVWGTQNGPTWIQEDDAPFEGRHTFGNGVRADGKYWIWGGDEQAHHGVAQTDVWTWDEINEWIEITPDWGPVAGNRWAYGHCIHNDYMYLIGGTVLNVARSLNGIDWEFVCDLPEGYNVFSGFACSHLNDIYVICGVGNTHVFKLINGVTFSALPDVIGEMIITTSFPSIRSWNGKIFYLAGSGTSGNQNMIFFTNNGMLTWNKLSTYPQAGGRHAAGFNTFGEDLYIVAGNGADDVEKIYKIPYVALYQKAVWSIRLVNPNYMGYCMTIRNDSAQFLDIGYINGELDTNAILSHIGSGKGKVSRWYNNYDSNYDLIQIDPMYMPLIADAGFIIIQNNKPALKFYIDACMYLSSMLNVSSKYVLSSVMNLDVNEDTGNKIFLRGQNNNGYGFFNQNIKITHANGNTLKPFAMSSTEIITSGTQRLLEVYRNRMTLSFYDNGVYKSAPSYGDVEGYGTYWDTDFLISQIGQEYGFGYAFSGYLQELNIHEGVIEPTSSGIIQTGINNYFNIY